MKLEYLFWMSLEGGVILAEYSYIEALALVVYARLIGRPYTTPRLCDRLSYSEWAARRLLRAVEDAFNQPNALAACEAMEGERDTAAWRVAVVVKALTRGDRL